MDLPTELGLAVDQSPWVVYAFVTLACIVGLFLTRQDSGTGWAAVGKYLNAVVGILALLATGIAGRDVLGLVVWIAVGMLVILGVAAALISKSPRRAT
ncbi:MAG: hypothetical protein ACYC1E_03705 [Propionibacteriaceae bacterium]